jgi:hypothetical protein
MQLVFLFSFFNFVMYLNWGLSKHDLARFGYNKYESKNQHTAGLAKCLQSF